MWIRALIIQNARRARTIVTGLEDYSEISAVLGDLCDATNTAQALDVHIDGGLPVSIAGKVVGKETSPPCTASNSVSSRVMIACVMSFSPC